MSGPRKPRKGITRKAPLSRSWIKPSRPTKPKATNPARRKKAFARSYHSVERVLFVKGLACIVGMQHECIYPIENAHVVTGGMGRKGDYTSIVPLCFYHHAVLHRMGAEAFQRHYVCDFAEHAPAVEALWQAHGKAAA